MTQKHISIAGRRIGPDDEPYVIAEMSGNHNGDINRAVEILTACAKAGADAVKLQTYTADTMTIRCERPEFSVEGGLWDGMTLYDLYEWAHTPWDWHPVLFDKGRELGVTVFSTPFDESAVDFLEDLGAPAYKIASFEAVDLSLIRKAASTKKPLIISTGMCDADDISEALEAAREGGCRELALLHCVSGYPTPVEDSDLRTITDIASKFAVPVGLSDHTLDIATAVASIALGACIIEKHVTLLRADGGPDCAFSLEPKEFSELCRHTKNAWRALGHPNYELRSSEKANVIFRRSLYVVKDMDAGEEFTPQTVRAIRPGCGLRPKNLPEVLGRKARSAIERGTPMSWELME